MTIVVDIDNQLYDQAKIQARIEHRTIAAQLRLWAMVGKNGLDKPDLPIEFVRDLLLARAEGFELASESVPRGKPSNAIQLD